MLVTGPMDTDMKKVGKSPNKTEYKLLLVLLKVIPMLLAACYFLNTVFGYLGIPVGGLCMIGGVSFLTLAFLYLSSFVFGFCIYHRMFLHYVLVTDALNAADAYIGLPLSDRGIFSLYMIVAGIFLFLILYYRQKEKCSR